MSDISPRFLEQVEHLLKAAEGESHRAKIILFATQIDETLKDLLTKFLKPRRAKKEMDDVKNNTIYFDDTAALQAWNDGSRRLFQVAEKRESLERTLLAARDRELK